MSQCLICGDTGLLPFIKNGKVIPNAQVFCECGEPDREYSPSKPTDFDFAMSHDFRSYYEEMATGRPLPSTK